MKAKKNIELRTRNKLKVVDIIPIDKKSPLGHVCLCVGAIIKYI